ncbi:hypothetical protein BGP_1049 [Beggiatoa sp. PS]|nr:hypothetical protein BGP_1049 [Beggiatoa sp. PS]
MLGKEIVWIFASSRSIQSIKSWHKNDQVPPFDNRLKIRYLGLLEPLAIEKIIKLGKFNSEEAKQIKTWAGRHPYYLKLLAQHLQDAREEGIRTALDHFIMNQKNY